jgi:hypothetical protein
MDVTRRAITREHLAGVARAALGADHRLVGVSRLRGGTKKGVYRLAFDDDSTAIAYVWDDAENYWPTTQADDTENHADPFSPASGVDLFEAAHRRLDALGIRTPRIHLADRSGSHYPADIAVVEDVPGENLETLLEKDPRSVGTTMARPAETLDVMRRHTRPGFGKVALIDDGGVSQGRSCEQIVLDRAFDDLAEAASRDPRIGQISSVSCPAKLSVVAECFRGRSVLSTAGWFRPFPNPRVVLVPIG